MKHRTIHTRTAAKLALAGAIAGGLIGTGIGLAANAHAVPGDPHQGCESAGMFDLTLICDGPIRPDGSWKRCSNWSPIYVPGQPGGFAPGGNMCRIVGPGNIPFGTPAYHIED